MKNKKILGVDFLQIQSDVILADFDTAHTIIKRHDYNRVVKYFSQNPEELNKIRITGKRSIIIGTNFFEEHKREQQYYDLSGDLVIVDVFDYNIIKNILKIKPKIFNEIIFKNVVKEKYHNPNLFLRLIWLMQFKRVKKIGPRCVDCAGGNPSVECTYFKCPCAANQQLKRRFTFNFLYSK